MSRTRAAIHAGLMLSQPHHEGGDAAQVDRHAQAFDDADGLVPVPTPTHPSADPDFVNVLRSTLRADLGGIQPGAFLRLYADAAPADKEAFRLAAVRALEDPDLLGFIDASPQRQEAALRLSLALTQPDPATGHNDAALARLATIADWSPWPNQLIIVPGYTPLDTTEAAPGVHPVARERLEEAAAAYREGQAPFIMVSGANVYPAGTPYYEGLEMKKALLEMGIPESAIIVEARARHSTTNLRNAGRFMLDHGMTRALITPPGGGIAGSTVFDQAFYFSHQTLSTFDRRCRRELGYEVGELEGVTDRRVSFIPSADVQRLNYRDPLDP